MFWFIHFFHFPPFLHFSTFFHLFTFLYFLTFFTFSTFLTFANLAFANLTQVLLLSFHGKDCHLLRQVKLRMGSRRKKGEDEMSPFWKPLPSASAPPQAPLPAPPTSPASTSYSNQQVTRGKSPSPATAAPCPGCYSCPSVPASDRCRRGEPTLLQKQTCVLTSSTRGATFTLWQASPGSLPLSQFMHRRPRSIFLRGLARTPPHRNDLASSGVIRLIRPPRLAIAGRDRLEPSRRPEEVGPWNFGTFLRSPQRPSGARRQVTIAVLLLARGPGGGRARR